MNVEVTEESIWKLPIAGTGIKIMREKTLEPWLERDHFSGGFNEDARVRNLELLNKARVYVCKLPRVQWTAWATKQYDEFVLAPEHMIAKLSIESDSPFSLRRHHPATLQWVAQEVQIRASEKKFSAFKERSAALLSRIDETLAGRQPKDPA